MTMLKKNYHLTETGSVSGASISSTEKGMAHFAGTSGDGRQCKNCGFWQTTVKSPTRASKRYCQKYIQMTGDEKKALPGHASACRYIHESEMADA